MNNQDKPVAIITGAGRGIGRATAIKLAELNYRVVLVSRNHDELSETANLCGHGLIAQADVCDHLAVEAVVKRTMKQTGRIDALVHNAGLAKITPIDQMDPKDWQATIDTNLSAAYFFARALFPVWRRQQGGVMVNISSIAARDPFPGFAAYAAAKAGINAFSLALAREGADFGVRVHTVAPGATETVMLRSNFTPQQFSPDQAMSPSEVADVIALCVRGDLRYSSGEVIYLQKKMR
jgi:NAD(P)-dependent dehydrogenase (short-subunit alcohol dehydrogenase family)